MFPPIVGLFEDPILDSGSIAPHGPQLEEEQRADGQHDAQGQAQSEERRDQREERQVDSRAVASAIKSVIETKGLNETGLSAADHREEEEADEVAVVAMTDAVVDPGTMMIHFHDAAIAFSAMVRSRRFVAFARGAVLKLGFGLGVTRSPAQWHESRSVHHGGHQVVRGQAGHRHEAFIRKDI